MFTNPKKNIELSYIAEGMKVAEFGAGLGQHTLVIARKVGEAGAVYAIEIQKDHVESLHRAAVRENLNNIHPILGNVERLGGTTLSDHSVDRVLIFNTLYQLEDKKTALNEAYRVLKLDGMLAIIDWQDSFNNMGPHPENVIKENAARKLAEEARFKFAREFEAGSHHYGLLFKL